MRILLATDSYPPLIGGATRAAQLLAHELQERGHRVHVATIGQPGSLVDDDDEGVPVSRLRATALRLGGSADPYRKVPPPAPDPELVLALRRLLRAFRPDVVHAYGWLAYSCAAAVGRSTPLLLSARDYANVCAVRTLMRGEQRCSGPALGKCLRCAGRFYGVAKGTAAVVGVLGGRPLLRRRVRGLHSVSRFVEATMDRHLLDGRDGAVARAVIPDFREQTEALKRTGIGLPGEPYIVYVGALRRVKGVSTLVQAWQALDERPPLVLVGTRAPDTPEAFPAGVSVLLDAPYSDVMAAFDGALFAVAPSLWYEPLGNVVHEAESRGRAVIGTTPGGHDDMITDGVEGLLVPPGDTAALRHAMTRLLADPPLRVRMGTAGRERAARFTAEQVVPQFEALYRELVAGA